MHRLDNHLLLSATDLINYLECPHLTFLDREVVLEREVIEKTRTDSADLVARKGDEHESAYVEALRAAGREVVEIARGEPGLAGLRAGAEQTRKAMADGAEIVYQGVLFDGARWRGYSDFLERVEAPSAFGSWSYEVADTKLARRVKPYFLLQLCFYSELLAQVQGTAPESMHVVLGTQARESFRVAEFSAYYRSVKARFDRALLAELGGTYPEPVEHCGLCSWEAHCDARRAADDHLSQVANMRRSQTVRLRERGIATMAALAGASPEDRPARIGADTFATLREQAKLQVRQRQTGAVSYELLDLKADHGFARLPPPSEGDLYFDMEGDPFFDGGLEYLFGVTEIVDGEPVFHAFWATDRGEEKVAFEAFIDFVAERRRRTPELHVYHYAPYEPTALKRLMGLHATREDELDDLLRNHVLVDLYAVVRQGLRISQPSYSIKKVEAFYMGGRETEVGDGGDSIVAFEEYLDTRDDALLEAIERYNDDDCRSTWLLHRWLLDRRAEAAEAFDTPLDWKAEPSVSAPDPEITTEVDALRLRLTDGLPENVETHSDEEHAHWLLAQLLDYHRREAKPAWWEYFARLDAEDAHLIEVDNEALGGLEDSGIAPVPIRRSLIHTLRFPPQDHKIGPGRFIDRGTGRGVTVERVIEADGLVEIKRAARATQPLPTALIPGGPYDTRAQRAAVRRFATDVAERGLSAGGRFAALRAMLLRDLPRTTAREAGASLQPGSFELEDAKRIVAGLDGSCLFIQGPPGSGKTYAAAHLICHLLDAGLRVGVASSSHAAIHNLLCEVEQFAGETPSWRGVKRPGSDEGSQYRSRRPNDPLIENSTDIVDCTSEQYRLVAGTAWLFSREDLDSSLDVLFVDEAGQLSLADTFAIGTSARNLVLLGDPLQLAQVSRAIHPPGAGASALEHLLGPDTTIPSHRGLFIDQTRRMHPDVCGFISETVYEGRLSSHEACARQGLHAPGELSGTGVRYVPVQHAGNARQSPEEAQAIAAHLETLAGADYVDADGVTRPLVAADVMVVAPYNAQVRCLREHLPDGVRIGTVDKFQGQAGVVTFFSMATSSGDELPRNLEFLFSRNRLNVAISRARCMAVLVCSPELLNVRCRSAEQMRLVNALCRLVEVAGADDA
jgi:predicted RecB family nuclease